MNATKSVAVVRRSLGLACALVLIAATAEAAPQTRHQPSSTSSHSSNHTATQSSSSSATSSHGTPSPRIAVPRVPQAAPQSRHQPRSYDGDHDHGRYYGRGHYGGYGGYGGYWDPWYSDWGFYWGGPYSRFGIGWGPSYWGFWGPYYGEPYGYYQAPYNRYQAPYDGYRAPYDGRGSGRSGALDTDVWPEEAQIFVDGRYVGIADNFDGYPDFLWLPVGTYDVVIYHPGYQTIARQYTIRPGVVTDVEDEMQRGEAVRPENLPATSHDRRDFRLQRDQERQERADEMQRQRQNGDDWRARRPGDEVVVRPQDEDRGVEPPDQDEAHEQAAPGDTYAQLHLQVEPADASIYLDGRFLGAGDELAGRRGAAIVEPGKHTLQAVRPGYETQEIEFTARAGEDVNLTVKLDERD